MQIFALKVSQNEKQSRFAVCKKEKRRLNTVKEILIESNGDRLHGWFQFLFG